MKNIFKTAIAVTMAVIVSGCSIFVPTTQVISINGEPAGAKIIVNGMPYSGPCTVAVKRNRMVSILVSKKGYSPYTGTIGTSLNTFGILDVVGGVCFLFPFIGLIAPGAFSLDQDAFYYILTPESK